MVRLLPVLLVLLVLLLGIGCQGSVPDNIYVPDTTTKPDEQYYDIEPSVPASPLQLSISYANVSDITPSSGMLEFKTNHPCTATIIIQQGEYVVDRFYIATKASHHYYYMTGLKPITDYIVIIEAEGSSSARKVIRFMTYEKVIIYDYTPRTYFYGGGYSSGSSSTIISATWHHGDGSFSGNTWQVEAKAGEIKHCYFTINNQTAYDRTIKLQTSVVSGITINADDLYVPKYSSAIFGIAVTISGDQPVDTYNFTLEFVAE